METQTKNTVTGQMIFDAIKANAADISLIFETEGRVAQDLSEIKAHLSLLTEQLAAKTQPAAELRDDEKPTNDPHCPECGNEVWDNRADPKRGKRPLMKCKDGACGWVTWKKEDCAAAEAA